VTATTRGIIVLMDDSEIVLQATKATLELRGFDVRTASNLAELERALEGTRPALFVLDVNMPEMYGDDVARVLRHMRNLSVPVILFSDIDEAALSERGQDAGVQACVPKRLGLSGLVNEVERVLGPPVSP
jgi:DNA-binding response OmpR family regulator